MAALTFDDLDDKQPGSLQSNYARNAPYVRKGASDFFTHLPPDQERNFRGWVQSNKVPFDPNADVSDYDMRGFWRALQSGDQRAKSAIDPNDQRMHYPDYWKTPYHQTFSNESQWAGPDAPHWSDAGELIDKIGGVLFDDRTPDGHGYAAGGAVTFDDLTAPDQTDPADAFADRIRQSEHSREGQVSPKGAQGVMQVMPNTQVDPGFGVTPAKDNSPEERERVGRDYAKAMYKRYGGDETLAAAAYNAGPGHLDTWVGKYGDPRSGKISDVDFAKAIPVAETRDYAGPYAGRKPSAGAVTFDDVAPGSSKAAAGALTFDDLAPKKPKSIWEHIQDLMGGAQLPDPSKPQDTWLQQGKKFAQNVPAMLENSVAGLIEGAGAPGDVPKSPGVTVPYPGMLAPSETTQGGGSPAIEAVGKKLRDQAQKQLQGNAPNVPGASLQGFTQKVGEGAVGFAPSFAIGAATGSAPAMIAGAATQAYGDAFASARAQGATPQQATDQAAIAAASTAIGFKMFEFSPFRHSEGVVRNDMTGEVANVYRQTIGDTIKNLTLQGMGIQPAIAAVEKVTDNIVTGKEPLDGLPGPLLQSGFANTIMAGVGHIAARRRLTAGEWKVPQNEAYPYDPSIHFGEPPPIEPEGAGGPPGPGGPGPGAAPRARLGAPPIQPPARGDFIGVQFPDGTVRRAEVMGFGANGRTTHLRYEDGDTAEHLTSEVTRDMRPAPPATYEPQATPPKPYQRQLGPDEGKAPPFGEAPPLEPGKAAQAKIAARQPQPVLDPQAVHALDLADRLEAAAADPGNPMSIADRMAAMMQVARIRQQFQPQGEESRPNAYRHPGSGEPAADLGELGVARVSQPENYDGQYERQPFAPSHVSRGSLDLNAATPYRPMDLLQFLGSRGGLQSDDPYVAGNLQAMDAHRKFLPNSGMLVRKSGGMPLDKAREAAQEAGYGTGYNNFETTDDLLDAVRDQLGGKDVFSHTENGGIEAAQNWQAHKAAERIGPQDEREDRDNIEDYRHKAEQYGIPVGEDWTAEDLMAAVHEREAVMAERAHDSEAEERHLADLQELNIDHHLAISHPEVYARARGEGIAEEDPFGHAEEPVERQPATQPEAAAVAGERGGEGAPGKETGTPGAGGRASDSGETEAARDEAQPAHPVEEVRLAEENVNPEPSAAQIEAGNYKHGHTTIEGVPVSIENATGSKRRGVGPDGKPWETTLEHPYGYVKRSEGADGEQVDVYIGPHTDSPDVFVIDQIDPKSGEWDEHKAVMGARTEEQAREIYNSGFSDGSGPERMGAITAMPVDEFKAWAQSGPKREPIAYQELLPEPAHIENPPIDRQAGEDLKTAAATAGVRADPVADEAEQTIDENIPTHLPEALDDVAWKPAGEAEGEPPAAGRPDEAGKPVGPVGGEAESRPPSAAKPEGGGHPAGEGIAARAGEGARVTENKERNGVEVRFKERPTDDVLGKLKAAGFRWSKPQKLWYAKRSDRTLAVANSLKSGAEVAKPAEIPQKTQDYALHNTTFTTTPGAIAAEHAAEVSSLEAQGTAAAAPANKARAADIAAFRDKLDRYGAYHSPRGDYKIVEVGFGQHHGYAVEVTERGARITLGGVAHQGLWSRDKAVQEAVERAFPAGSRPTEAAAQTGAAEAARAEMDAAVYQPAAMPITNAAPPPKKPVDLFSIGDAVQPKPEFESDLPPRSGDRYVTNVSPDGRQVTLDGGAILPSTAVEPTLGHGLQEPVSERHAGQRPEAVSAAGEERPNRPAPQRENNRGLRVVGGSAGAGTEGAGRPATRSPGAAAGRGARDVTDAGLPESADHGAGAAERPDAGVKGENFVIEPGALAESRGPKAKASDNLAAIELAKRLTAEKRAATKEEQGTLAKYVGWGGLAGAFPDSAGKFGTGFEDIGRQLKAVLSKDEYETASRSTQYAHYTAENVIRSMWDAVKAMGFEGGGVFEPGMGVGHFLGLMPPDVAAKSQYEGIELDHLTAEIASHLYPKSGVRQANFIETPMPENAFDLVIGNPPFSDTVIKADPKYSARHFMLHDYFFAKSLDSVRPGGLLAFVTSAGTMNKIDPAARNYLGQRAEFLGGVRLPSNAFRQNAGTEVTTDILFFQKRPEEIGAGEFAAAPEAGWATTVQRELPNAAGGKTTGNVSRYFSEHPEQVLGREGFFDKFYEGRYAVHADQGSDLADGLQRALGNLPKDIYWPPLTPREKAAADFSSGEKKDGSFYMKDGRLMQYQDGAGRPVLKRGAGVEGGATAADMEKIQKLIPIRDALREVFAHDLAERPEEAAAAREKLNRTYDAFTRKYGPLNKADYQYRRPNVIQQEYARSEARELARDRGEVWREGSFNGEVWGAGEAKVAEIARARQVAREAHGPGFDEGSFDPSELPDIVIEKRPNIDPFQDDQESYRLRAIEDYNEKTGIGKKRRVFFESVLTREQEPVLNSVEDGVLWSLNKLGRFDVDAIAAKMGKDRGEVIGELGDKVFKVPGTKGVYQTADEYLSGDILTKLDDTRAAAEHDPEIRRNLPALEAAVPAPLSPSEISMSLGMPWIPPQFVEEFARDHLRIGENRIRHNKALGGWTLSPVSNGADNAIWGVDDLPATKMLAAALNRRAPRMYKEIYVPGEGTKREFDPVATQAAQDKYERMRDEFRDWITSDPERADQLAAIYNGSLNRAVLRTFDGSYLTTPGISAEWSWRPHQKRVVARIIQAGNTYMAHAVGAGKTSAMIGAGMEMRRLGLVNKPMYVVPNFMLGQFTKEFYEQYPTAQLMVADERRFHTSRRKQFIANAAQSDLDAIIITHDAFGRIPISGKFQQQLIGEQLDAIEEAMKGLDKGDDRITRKRLENQKEKLEQQIKAATSNRKDQTNTFEEMGVDFLFIDEAHKFRKLPFATKQSGLKGIDPDGSQKAFDLYAKIRYLETKKPGRSAALASGTPVTNTMGELYSISRYLQRDALQDKGIEHFDSWASTFGDTKQALEPTPDGGYQSVTRFAKFVNMPELYKMVGSIMDVVTPSQLDQYVVRPKLKGGKRQYDLAPRTDDLVEYQAGLGRRMQEIKLRKGPPEKGDDIILSVISDGRKAAIDLRMADPSAPNDPDSKLNRMIAKVFKIHQESKDTQFYDPKTNYQTPTVRGRATQMIFSNLGIGDGGGDKFSGYAWMKRELLRMGVAPSEIAFIKDYKSAVAKQKLFNDMNEGVVRILIGSTDKMGVGVNAQKRLIAIHNLDPLWFPADDEQRVGRGVRQGNMNPEIGIHDYSTEGTYDSTMWQMMGRKARFIEDFFRGDPELRDMEDLGEASVYDQAAAMSASDPRLMQLTDLRQQLDKAQRRAAAHDREQYSMRNKLQESHETVARADKRIPEIRQDIARRKLPGKDEFAMTVNGKKLDQFGDAATALKQYVDEHWKGLEGGGNLKIGELGGFQLFVHKSKYDRDMSFFFERSNGQTADLSATTPVGAIRAMQNRLAGFEGEIAYLENNKAEADKRIKSLSSQIGKPFTGGDEIARLRQEVKDLEAALKPKEEDKGASTIKAQRPTFDQTQTPEFRNWFGDSKIVDGQGEPLRVYRGLEEDHDENVGRWFTSDTDTANAYAESLRTGAHEEGSNVVPAYLAVKNPLEIDAGGARYDRLRFENEWHNTETLAEIAAKRGHDGLIVRNVRDGSTKPIDVFHPLADEQVKSAIGNRGTFDPNNPDIRAQEQPASSKSPSIWADIGGTKRLAPDFYARMPRIPSDGEAHLIEEVNKILKQIVPRAKVVTAKELILSNKPVWGATYSDGGRAIIAWSMQSPDAIHTALHEAIHWLRNVGFFSPEEWETLVKAAKAGGWLEKHDIERRYAGEDEATKLEEAICEESASWARRETTPPPEVRTLFGRLRDALGRIAKYLRSLFGKDVTAEDIFKQVLSGEIGSRQPVDGWKPDPKIFAQAAKTPEGPPETAAEGREYIDATAKDLAEHMRAKGPGTYERTLQNLTPSSGPELYTEARWLQRMVAGPRTVAELDTKSGRFWAAIQREEDEAGTRLHDLRDNIKDNFLNLPRESQDRVHAVMEIDRLDGRTRTDDGRSIISRNTEHEDARGSKPGQTVILTPDETKAYFGLQRMYRHAWDNVMEGTARRMGWGSDGSAVKRPWSPAMADNFKSLQRAIDTSPDAKNRKAFQRIFDVMTAMEDQRRQAYMPLMRYGDYFFSVTPKVDRDSTGGFPESVWFSLAERPSMSYADIDPRKAIGFEVTQQGQVPDYAKKELAQLQARFNPKEYRINHGFLLSKADALRQMSIPAIEKLMTLMESGVLDRIKTEASMDGMANKGAAYKKAKEEWQNLYEELVDAVRDEMYEQIKAGFKKRARTVPGYSGDFNRTLGSYMGWTTKHVAKQIHGDTIEGLYDDIQTNHPHESIRDFWKRWKQDDDSPMEPLSRVGVGANQIGFLWTMALNPASTVSLMMHGPTYAIPTLGTGIGVPKAAAAFTRAYGEAISAVRWDPKHGGVIDISKLGRTPDERYFLRGMETAGYLHAKGADDIRSMTEKASPIWGDYSEHAKQVMDIVSSNIAVADQANRVSAALAAYRLARDGNLGHMNATWAGNQMWRAISDKEGVSPESMAKFLLNQSVGEWGGRSRSRFGRSPAGRMLTALKGFVIRFLSNMLKQMKNQGAAGRIALAWSMAGLWAAAGLQGLPEVEDAESLIDHVWKFLTKHDPMLAYRMRAMLVDAGLGRTGADIVLRGPLSVFTGTDFHSRLGMGNIISKDVAPFIGASEDAAVTVASVIGGAITGYQRRHASHQDAAAAASLLPGGLRHPVQAVIDAEHGVKSQSGKHMYVPRSKFTTADAIKEGLGFAPLDVARARERAEFQYKAKNAHGPRPRDETPR